MFLSSIPLPEVKPAIPHLDKIAHLAMYGVFAYFLARNFATSEQKALESNFRLFAVALAFIYGIMLELLQNEMPSRTASIMDAFANGAGAIIGQLFFPPKLNDFRLRLQRITHKLNKIKSIIK